LKFEDLQKSFQKTPKSILEQKKLFEEFIFENQIWKSRKSSMEAVEIIANSDLDYLNTNNNSAKEKTQLKSDANIYSENKVRFDLY